MCNSYITGRSLPIHVASPSGAGLRYVEVEVNDGSSRVHLAGVASGGWDVSRAAQHGTAQHGTAGLPALHSCTAQQGMRCSVVLGGARSWVFLVWGVEG